jgi:hypothetical protein
MGINFGLKRDGFDLATGWKLAPFATEGNGANGKDFAWKTAGIGRGRARGKF